VQVVRLKRPTLSEPQVLKALNQVLSKITMGVSLGVYLLALNLKVFRETSQMALPSRRNFPQIWDGVSLAVSMAF
jgi:hypothetical protein